MAAAVNPPVTVDPDASGEALARGPLVGALLKPAHGLVRLALRNWIASTVDLVSAAATATETLLDRRRNRQRGPAVLRVQVVILRDENGEPVCAPEEIEEALELADQAFHSGAGIRVRHLVTVVADQPSATNELDAHGKRQLLRDHIRGLTRSYQDWEYRLSGPGGVPVGRPLTVVVVRSLAGTVTGTSLGSTTDWVLVQAGLFRGPGADPTVLAHELGHACNLRHHQAGDNLMFPRSGTGDSRRGTKLTRLQAAVLRTNRHVLPGVTATR